MVINGDVGGCGGRDDDDDVDDDDDDDDVKDHNTMIQLNL